MQINESNKQIYEKAFILNGEYANQTPSWNPDINERNIEETCEGPDGKWIPATPLGYRDYSISRLEGLKNILDQDAYVDLSKDKLYEVKREDNVIKQYDKIKTDKGDFVVVGDDEDAFYVVNNENHLFYVQYVNNAKEGEDHD